MEYFCDNVSRNFFVSQNLQTFKRLRESPHGEENSMVSNFLNNIVRYLQRNTDRIRKKARSRGQLCIRVGYRSFVETLSSRSLCCFLFTP